MIKELPHLRFLSCILLTIFRPFPVNLVLLDLFVFYNLDVKIRISFIWKKKKKNYSTNEVNDFELMIT